MPPVGRAGRAGGGCGPCLPRRQALWKTLRPAQGVLAKIRRKSLPALWEGRRSRALPRNWVSPRGTPSQVFDPRGNGDMGARRTRGPILGCRGGPGTGPSPSPPPGAVGAARAPQAQITCWSAQPLCPQARPSLPALCLPHRLARQAAPVRTGGFTDKAEVLHCKTDKTIKPHPGAGQAVSSPGTFLEGEPCNPGPLPPATCATRDGDTLSHPSSTHQLWLQGPTGCPRPFGVGSGHASQLVCPVPCEAPAARGTRPQPPQGPGLTHSVRSLPPPLAPPQHWEPSPTDRERPATRPPVRCHGPH